MLTPCLSANIFLWCFHYLQRFGPSTEWMSFIDTDEYLVPMKKNTWKDVLDDMEKKNVQVLKMRSSKGLPRRDLME